MCVLSLLTVLPVDAYRFEGLMGSGFEYGSALVDEALFARAMFVDLVSARPSLSFRLSRTLASFVTEDVTDRMDCSAGERGL